MALWCPDLICFFTSYFGNKVSEYTTSGSVVNASLITGLSNPLGIAIAADAPEPGTLALLGLGLAVFAIRKKTATR